MRVRTPIPALPPTPTVGAVYDCTILILDLGGRRQSLQVRNAGPSMTRRCGIRRRSRFLHFPAIASLGRLLTRSSDLDRTARSIEFDRVAPAIQFGASPRIPAPAERIAQTRGQVRLSCHVFHREIGTNVRFPRNAARGTGFNVGGKILGYFQLDVPGIGSQVDVQVPIQRAWVQADRNISGAGSCFDVRFGVLDPDVAQYR